MFTITIFQNIFLLLILCYISPRTVSRFVQKEDNSWPLRSNRPWNPQIPVGRLPGFCPGRCSCCPPLTTALPSLVRSKNCEKRLLASSCPSVCSSVSASVRTGQLGSHWTDCDETWYLTLFRKSVQENQISLKSDENNGYFTWRRFDIFDAIPLHSFIMENVLDKFVEKIKTHFMFDNLFPKITPFMI